MVLACFVCQLGLGYTYLFSAVLPEATAELGWTRAEFSAGRVPYFVMTALGGLAAGQWTVRFGARPVLVVGALSLAGALALLSRMQDLATYWVAQVLYGLFMAGLGDVAIAGVLTAWVRRGRGAAMGFVYAASNVAGFFVPQIFARGVESQGWRATLLAMGFGTKCLGIGATASTTSGVSERPLATSSISSRARRSPKRLSVSCV